MPTDPNVLGFSNRWYSGALRTAEVVSLPYDAAGSPSSIRLVSAPYFVATKLEAFADRGKGDLMSSRDIEDIIAVVDGRVELHTELQQSQDFEMRGFITGVFRAWLSEDRFLDALEGHLFDQSRFYEVKRRIEKIAQIT